jgi:hypothetical protein
MRRPVRSLVAVVSVCVACKTSPPTVTDASAAPSVSAVVPQPSAHVMSAPSFAGTDAGLADVSRGDRDFAARLYQRLRTGTSGNLFFSPTSVRLVLAMVYAGASGDTRRELERVAALDGQTANGFAALLTRWAAVSAEDAKHGLDHPQFVLDVASRLWAQDGLPFRPEFLAMMQDDYAAPLGKVDFAHGAEACRQRINAWVADATNHKINELLLPGVVSDQTRLVLANAVYFKARWQSEFDKGQTKEEPFFAAGGKEVRTAMMHLVSYPSYVKRKVSGAGFSARPCSRATSSIRPSRRSFRTSTSPWLFLAFASRGRSTCATPSARWASAARSIRRWPISPASMARGTS